MKTDLRFFNDYFSLIDRAVKDIDLELLIEVAKMIWRANLNGRKIILVGNGGSAAMASHLSVDLTKAAGVRAINFNEADLLTCFSNDFGYENWVARAFEFYADKNDLAILISSSGKSQNIINAVTQARRMELPVITFSGFNSDNPLRELGDINFWCDSNQYNVVEMVHHIWLLSIVDYVVHCRNSWIER